MIRIIWGIFNLLAGFFFMYFGSEPIGGAALMTTGYLLLFGDK